MTNYTIQTHFNTCVPLDIHHSKLARWPPAEAATLLRTCSTPLPCGWSLRQCFLHTYELPPPDKQIVVHLPPKFGKFTAALVSLQAENFAMAQQIARNADIDMSLEESVDVPSDLVAHSAFGKGSDTYTTLAQDAPKGEGTVSSSRGTEELGHLVEEVSPDPYPANTTVAAIYDPGTGTYSRPDTGRIDAGPIGSTLNLDEHLQERLEKLEPPAADARLHSARIKRGATEIDKNLGMGSDEPSAPPPQEPGSDESSFGQRQTENLHDLDPIQQLKKAEIIPLLIDRVQGNPSLKFEVKFDGKAVSIGATLQPQDIHQAPDVLLYKHGVVTPEDVYLLLLVDMDFSEHGGYLHWLVQNVPSPTEACMDPVRVFGQEMMPYVGISSPAIAQQDRLVFLLYKMKRKLMSSAAPRTRENFVPRHFAQNNELGQPEAALYFRV